MFTIENFISYEVVQKIGWVLLHFTWQAAAVAFVLVFALRVMRRFSASTRYIAACLALVVVVLMPFVTMRFIHIDTPPATIKVEAAPAIDIEPLIATTEVIIEAPVRAEPVKSIPSQQEPPVIKQRINWKERAVTFLEPKLSAIVTIWLFGVFVLAIWHLGGYTQLQKLRRKMVKQVDSSLKDKLNILSQKLGVTQTVELLESALVQIPTVVGWLKPVILLPASALSGLTTEQLEAILAHELAHIKRYDYLVNILQTIVEIFGFYHPAVWWISHKIRHEREHCCDDIAVAICGDKIHYAKALASMEEIRGRDHLAVAATGGNLFLRICRLIGKDSNEKNALSWIPSLTVVLLLIALTIPTIIVLDTKADSKEIDPNATEQVEPQDTNATYWITVLPNSPIRNLEDYYQAYIINTLKPDGEEIKLCELEIRSVENNERIARIKYENFLSDYINTDKILTGSRGGSLGLNQSQIRNIGRLPDGKYLIAFYINGIRCSNIAAFSIDSNFDAGSEPTISLIPIELTPGHGLPYFGIRAVGPTPQDPNLMNVTIAFPKLVVDSIERNLTMMAWSGPIAPLESGKIYTRILSLDDYSPAIEHRRKHTIKAIVNEYQSQSVVIPADNTLAKQWDEATEKLLPVSPLNIVFQGNVIGPDGKSGIDYEIHLFGKDNQRYSEFSNKEGKYSFYNIPSGAYKIVCNPKSKGQPELIVEPVIIEANTPLSLNLNFEKKYKFAGKVTYEDNKPASGIDVWLTCEDANGNTEFSDSTCADANGMYELGGPYGNVTYIGINGMRINTAMPELKPGLNNLNYILKKNEHGKYIGYQFEQLTEAASGQIEEQIKPAKSEYISNLQWGQEVNGLRASVELIPDKESYSLGERIDVRFNIQNVSDKEIQLAYSGRLDSYLEILNSKGEDVSRPSTYKVGSGWPRVSRIKLEPNEIITLNNFGLGFGRQDDPALVKEIYTDPNDYTTREFNSLDPDQYTIQYRISLPNSYIESIYQGNIVPQPDDWQGVLKTQTKIINITAKQPDDPKRFELALERQSMRQAVHHLAQKYKARICFEEIENETASNPNQSLLTGNFFGSTISELLNKLTANGLYKWDKFNSTYVVYPAKGSILEYPVEQIFLSFSSLEDPLKRIIDQAPEGMKFNFKVDSNINLPANGSYTLNISQCSAKGALSRTLELTNKCIIWTLTHNNGNHLISLDYIPPERQNNLTIAMNSQENQVKEQLEKIPRILESIKNDIAAIEGNYPALDGFKENVKISNPRINYFELEFEKDLGLASKQNPIGILNTPESCLIRVRIQDHIDGQRQAGNIPGDYPHYIYLSELNKDIDIEINVSTNELFVKLNQVISKNISPLQELNNKTSHENNRKQVLIEMKLLEVDERYLNEEAIQQELLANAGTVTAVSHPLPYSNNWEMTYLDDSRIDSIFNEKNKNIKTLAQPALLVFDNEPATIKSLTEHPYVSGYKEPNNPNEKATPIVEFCKVGFVGTCTPHLDSDNQNTVMELSLERSQILDYREQIFNEKYMKHLPLIGRRSMHATITLSQGKTLVANIEEIKPEEENTSNPNEEKKELLLLIKATNVSSEQTQTQGNINNNDEDYIIGHPTNEFIINTSEKVQPVNEQEKSEDRLDQNQLPYSEIITYPENWRELSKNNKQDKPLLDVNDEAVRSQLEQIVDLSNFNSDMTFEEALEEFEKLTDPPLSIQPNWRALSEKTNITQTTQVKIRPLENIKIRSALDILLADISTPQAKISYTIRDGVIYVATIEDLPYNLVRRVYDINDLVNMLSIDEMMGNRLMSGPTSGYNSYYSIGGYGITSYYGNGMIESGYAPGYHSMNMMPNNTAKALKYLVMELIRPDSWHEKNEKGKGTIDLYPADNPTKMAVTNTIEVHKMIEKLLESLRKGLGEQVALETRFIYGTTQDINKIISGTSIETSDNAILDDTQVNFLIRNTQANENIKSTAAPNVTVLNGEMARFSSSNPNLSFRMTPMITHDHKNVIIHSNQNNIIIDDQLINAIPIDITVPDGKTIAYICPSRNSEQNNQTSTATGNMSLIVLIKPRIVHPQEMPPQPGSYEEPLNNVPENTQPDLSNEEMVQRTFDISDIVYYSARSSINNINSDPLAGIGGYGGGMMMGGNYGGIPNSVLIFEAQEIVKYIMNNIEPDSWYEKNNKANGTLNLYPATAPRKLAVTNTPAIHLQIEKYLESVRESIDYTQVAIETRYIYASEQAITDIFNNAGIGMINSTNLDDTQVNKLIKAAQDNQNAKSVAVPKVTVLNNETAIFTSIEQQSRSQEKIFKITPHVSNDMDIVFIDFDNKLPSKQNESNRPPDVTSTLQTRLTIINGKTYAFFQEPINEQAPSSDKMSLIILIKPTIIIPEGATQPEVLNLSSDPQQEKPNQVLIETQIIHVSSNFLEQLGLDANSLQKSDTWTRFRVDNSNEPNLFVIDELSATLLKQTIDTHKESKTEGNPSIIAQTGKQSEMKVITETFYVYEGGIDINDINEYSSGSQKIKSDRVTFDQLKKYTFGHILKFTPQIIYQNDIQLDMEFDIKKIPQQHAEVKINDKIVQTNSTLPKVITTFGESFNTIIPDGHTLLIIGNKISKSSEGKESKPLINLPLIKGLFKVSSNYKITDEYIQLFLVKPKILSPEEAEKFRNNPPETESINSLGQSIESK